MFRPSNLNSKAKSLKFWNRLTSVEKAQLINKHEQKVVRERTERLRRHEKQTRKCATKHSSAFCVSLRKQRNVVCYSLTLLRISSGKTRECLPSGSYATSWKLTKDITAAKSARKIYIFALETCNLRVPRSEVKSRVRLSENTHAKLDLQDHVRLTRRRVRQILRAVTDTEIRHAETKEMFLLFSTQLFYSLFHVFSLLCFSDHKGESID